LGEKKIKVVLKI